MARIFIVDERGARAGDLAAARERFDEANKSAFGADLDVHAHTPQNQIAGINALVATELGEELVRAALYGASINHSVGTFLDSLGSLLDIRRDPETRSRVVGLITGITGTAIPAGSLAKNADGDTFESETDAVIVEGGVSVGFIATEPGPKEVSPNTLTRIVSVRTGWDGITNPAEGILGRDRESDALYRANLKARTAQSSIGSIAALQSAIQSAGASRIKILENSDSSAATKGGVLLPAHSILVIADGGLADDISRAVENHRGMGVNTYTAIEGADFSIGEAQKINAGRMIFNGTEFGGFSMVGRTVPQMAVALNASTNAASFAESAGRLLTLHSWDTDSTGFEDLGGNISESGRALAELTPTTAQAHGRYIFLMMPEDMTSDPSSTVVKYTSGGSETTATVSSTAREGRMFGIYLSAAIPDAATDIKVTLNSLDASYETGVTLTDIPVTLSTDYGATDAPSVPVIYGAPRSGGAVVYGFSLGTVTLWQYRRWQDGSYLDSNWVTHTGVSFGTTLYADGTFTGFTNGSTCRLEIRALNGSHGQTATRSFVFTPSGDAPAITDSHIDGNLVTLTYDADLQPAVIASPGAAPWNFHTSGNTTRLATATRQQTIGRKVYLTLNNAISAGADWQVSAGGSSTNVFGTNGVRQTNFTNRALTNDTKGGIPSAPIAIVYRRTGTGWEADWGSNANGGLAIDRYEISTLPVGSNVWTAWATNSPATSTSHSATAATIPAMVRVRASNQNARSAEILGLLETGASVLPFARSVARPIAVEVSIHRDANITTSDFDAIKTSLVELVNAYEIGATIYQADLQARVEGIKSIRLAAALVATSNGIAIDGVVQNAYNRWTLAPDDISVTFVN